MIELVQQYSFPRNFRHRVLPIQTSPGEVVLQPLNCR